MLKKDLSTQEPRGAPAPPRVTYLFSQGFHSSGVFPSGPASGEVRQLLEVGNPTCGGAGSPPKHPGSPLKTETCGRVFQRRRIEFQF